MDLIVLIGPIAPFEKFDVACHLYTNVLNKDSFDLVVNTFDDVADRQNLKHLLQQDKIRKKEFDRKLRFLESTVPFPGAGQSGVDMVESGGDSGLSPSWLPLYTALCSTFHPAIHTSFKRIQHFTLHYTLHFQRIQYYTIGDELSQKELFTEVTSVFSIYRSYPVAISE